MSELGKLRTLIKLMLGIKWPTIISSNRNNQKAVSSDHTPTPTPGHIPAHLPASADPTMSDLTVLLGVHGWSTNLGVLFGLALLDLVVATAPEVVSVV